MKRREAAFSGHTLNSPEIGAHTQVTQHSPARPASEMREVLPSTGGDRPNGPGAWRPESSCQAVWAAPRGALQGL